MAGIRARAAGLIQDSGFTDRVRELLQDARAVHADQTRARVWSGGIRYVHLACTAYLTHLHTGDRSAPAIDAGQVLPGYAGIIARDGYHAGYGHLTGALHAWCGAHLLRDLKDLYDFEPGKQDRASKMAVLLIQARAAASARLASLSALDPEVLDGPGHPLPGARHVRARRERLPPDRDRERLPPDRPPVPEIRGYDPPLRYPS
jgi:transposase